VAENRLPDGVCFLAQVSTETHDG